MPPPIRGGGITRNMYISSLKAILTNNVFVANIAAKVTNKFHMSVNSNY